LANQDEEEYGQCFFEHVIKSIKYKKRVGKKNLNNFFRGTVPISKFYCFLLRILMPLVNKYARVLQISVSYHQVQSMENELLTILNRTRNCRVQTAPSSQISI